MMSITIQQAQDHKGNIGRLLVATKPFECHDIEDDSVPRFKVEIGEVGTITAFEEGKYTIKMAKEAEEIYSTPKALTNCFAFAVKLSELDPESFLLINGGSVRETKHLVEELRNGDIEVNDVGSIYTAKVKLWEPSAKRMVETYIDQQQDEMYEDFDIRAFDCFTEDDLGKIQDIIDAVFARDKGIETCYWEDIPVIIDVEEERTDA